MSVFYCRIVSLVVVEISRFLVQLYIYHRTLKLDFFKYSLLNTVILSLKKGQSNEIFDLQFFHNLNLPGLKYYKFWLRIRRVIHPWGTIPQRVNLPGYDTLVSQSRRSIIPWQVMKKFVKHDSPGHHSIVSKSSRGIIPQQVILF